MSNDLKQNMVNGVVWLEECWKTRIVYAQPVKLESMSEILFSKLRAVSLAQPGLFRAELPESFSEYVSRECGKW